ncbi:winged helix-turn-helix domain-containing protein [Stenotrophomonas riyadhensis]|uniref:winged helix-turn-helix domain-containing protein n=1 Tax=Stenotrophomonas TaxID=40323 RepID=UPI002010C116|nr:winged helix-turn-helix domain-containing protein [Stenotrophomonas sp. NY11291]UQA21525.1 winged helix-turn-helix domain-containing protein [Stenotrophomonas sp. NY11291]
MNHPARSTDPQSSHIAAADLVSTGKLLDQQTMAAVAVQRHPGQSSLHLAALTGLDRHMLGRRLPELAREGRIWRGPTAPCATTGKPACTWWPVAPGENMTLGL